MVGVQVELKNAVMMLNEMFPPPIAPQYKVNNLKRFVYVAHTASVKYRGENL